MRKQEFNSKLISLLPLDEVPVHVPLRRPRPLRFERLPVPVWNPYSRGRLSPAKSEDRKGGEGKADANLTHFFLVSTCCAWHPNSPPRPGQAPPPPPLPENLLLRLHKKLPSAPLRAPRRFRNPKIGQQLGAQPTPRFRVMIDALLDALARCNVRPMAALHFLPPTGDSRSGSRSFDSKLISLLPLDEVPVHVHPFAARVPCDSKGSECQCGIHTAEAASALRSRKTERAAKERPTQP